MSKQYADRDIVALDKAGGYYLRHVTAMTKEQLHSKSDIAAELAHRDMEIEQLREQLQSALLSEATARQYAEEVDKQNAALAATVEVFRGALINIRHSPDDHCAEIAADVLDKTPQQHLAEIRAQAAETAIKAVLSLPTFTAKDGDWLIKAIAWDKVLPFAKAYADSIRGDKNGQ